MHFYKTNVILFSLYSIKLLRYSKKNGFFPMDTDQVNNYQRQLHLPFADGMGLMLEKSYNMI